MEIGETELASYYEQFVNELDNKYDENPLEAYLNELGIDVSGLSQFALTHAVEWADDHNENDGVLERSLCHAFIDGMAAGLFVREQITTFKRNPPQNASEAS